MRSNRPSSPTDSRTTSYSSSNPSTSPGAHGRHASGPSTSSVYEQPWRIVSPETHAVQNPGTFTSELHMNTQSEASTPVETVLAPVPSAVAVPAPDGRIAKYPCSYCGKRFNRPSSLKVSAVNSTNYYKFPLQAETHRSKHFSVRFRSI